jgi:type 1 glutamine amidotransferase
MKRLVGTVLFGVLTLACSRDEDPAKAKARVLIFTKETLFFHTGAHLESDVAVPRYLRARGHEVTLTNDAAVFTPENLSRFDVCFFLNTSGIVFDDAQRAAFEAFIRSGKGFVGVHGASATEIDSAFMRGLVGAVFLGHGVGNDGTVTDATLGVVDASDRIVAHLPNPWTRKDEWYYFRENPADNKELTQLLRLDEATLPASYPAFGRTGIHPVAWRHEYMGGRAFYTALGHTAESYQDEVFLRMLAAGIDWAAAAGAK